MNCQVCYTSFEETPMIQLPCSCKHCADCLHTWILGSIKELSFQNKEQVLCMNAECKKYFNIEDILNYFSESQKTEINEALLAVYLNKSKDIRRCPKEDCNYAGVIDLNVKCKDKLECLQCRTQWREKLHYSKTEALLYMLREWDLGTSDLLCEVWEELFANKCPNCWINIEKNGGCPHMSCKKCNFQFCWYCGQDWKKHEAKHCGINLLVKLVIVFSPIFNILYYFGVVTYFLYFLGWLIRGVLKAALLDGYLYLVVFVIFDKRYHLVGYQLKTKMRIIIFSIFTILFLMMGYWLAILKDMVYLVLMQAAGLGCLIVYDRVLRPWKKAVF
jgi:Nucleoside permease